jgi:hypothetical protein
MNAAEFVGKPVQTLLNVGNRETSVADTVALLTHSSKEFKFQG